MNRQPVTDPPDDEDGEPPLMTAREHSRHTAAYLAADIAKSIPAGAGETIAGRVAETLAAADEVFAWLTS